MLHLKKDLHGAMCNFLWIGACMVVMCNPQRVVCKPLSKGPVRGVWCKSLWKRACMGVVQPHGGCMLTPLKRGLHGVSCEPLWKRACMGVMLHLKKDLHGAMCSPLKRGLHGVMCNPQRVVCKPLWKGTCMGVACSSIWKRLAWGLCLLKKGFAWGCTQPALKRGLHELSCCKRCRHKDFK